MEPVVLVTGIAGQIGGAAASLLRAARIAHRGLDRIPCEAGVPFLRCDLAAPDPAELRRFCAPVTHVIHLASRVTDSKDLGAAYADQFRIEVLGTLALLDALPAGLRHVAYASSMTVYGTPERLPVAEDHALRPHCVYALCKVAVERHLAGFGRARGIPSAALRISSVYGPAPSRRAIGAMIERVLRGEPPEVYGDGAVRRDYIHVSDAARAALSASLRAVPGPLNVGSGVGTSLLELARAVCRLGGLAAGPRLVPKPLDPQAAASMVYDVSRLAALTDFRPHVPLEQGLEACIQAARMRMNGGVR